MKILLGIHQFFPDFAAGTEVLTCGVARQLTALGHDVVIFTACPVKQDLKDSERFDRYVYNGLRVERFLYAPVAMGEQANIMEMEYQHDLVAAHFGRLLDRETPDIVHFFHLRRISSAVIDECLSRGVPAFYTPTDFWAACPLNQLSLPDGRTCPGPDPDAANCVRHLVRTYASGPAALLGRLPVCFSRLALIVANSTVADRIPPLQMILAVSRRRELVVSRLNHLKAIFVPSRSVWHILANIGVDSSLLRWSPFGIDLNYNMPPRSSGSRLRIGFIGTLSEHKGVHLLLNAMRHIPGNDIEVSIYGKQDEFPEYAGKLGEMAGQDSRIAFRGTFDNARIGEVFAGLDVLVVPSLWQENTPLVVYSAQACGCPVVASDVSGLSEVIQNGVNGILFPVGSVSELSAALKHLRDDRDYLRQLAANSRVPRSLDDYVTELIAAYQAAGVSEGEGYEAKPV